MTGNRNARGEVCLYVRVIKFLPLSHSPPEYNSLYCLTKKNNDIRRLEEASASFFCAPKQTAKGECMKNKNNRAGKDPCNRTGFTDHLKTMAAKVGAVIASAVIVTGTAFSAAGIVQANTPITYLTGEIEVDNVDGQVTTYKAFRIFDANKNEDGTMSNFDWPTGSIRNAVLGIIQQFTPSYTSTNAQDAADYISSAYQNASGEMTTDQTTILDNQELLNRIAAAVDDISGSIALTAGKTTVLSEGYWLIVTDGNSVGIDEDGTSPIYAIVSGGPVKITEKTSVPSVDKLILNDADGAEWSYGTEAERGQSVAHKVTGTVAKNIKTYDLYYYEFEDVMSKGIDYDMGSCQVFLDGTEVTGYFTETLTDLEDGRSKLSVACEDILVIQEAAVKADSELVLTYTVQLNDDCVVGVEGNPNDVRIIYSSNPNTREKSVTHVVRDYLYTFGLHLEKKDRDTNVPLASAKFTIQATGSDDEASRNKYVQADGRLGTEPYEFITDENGEFEVNGLDAGTYMLHETKCPEMYQVINKDTLFTIVATYHANGTIESLSNTVSANADAAAGIDTSNDNQVNGDAETAAIVKTCYVNVTVGNIEKVKMPLSGQNGIGIVLIIGFCLVGGSPLWFLIGKKKEKKTIE